MAAWGGAVLTVTVDGDDVSCDALQVSVDRSKNRLWDPVDATTCQIVLNLQDGGVASTTGPIGTVVVVHVAYGTSGRNLFTGRVQMRRLEAAPDGDVLVLDCVDGFELIGRVNVRAGDTDTPVGGGETPENRINRWLDVADWPSGDRDTDSSTYTCPETLLDGNALVQIQAAAQADGGEFYIDGDGIARFLAWAWRTATGPAAVVYSDRRLYDWVPYSSATLLDDLDEVQNQVTGTRRPLDDTDIPVPQTSINSGSVTAYGIRGDALDNLELEDDSQVADRVTALVAIAGMPSPRFDAVVVQPAFDPGRMWPRVLLCEFGSLVAANRVWGDSTEQAFYGHILGEIWTFTPDDATVTWRVSGTGSWDAHAPPRPPIRVVITPGGCVAIPEGEPCNDTDVVQFYDEDHNPVGDPFPPGSLCGDGICTIPDGATQVCFVNDFGEGCIDLPTRHLVLWFGVLDPGGGLIEWVEGTPLTGLSSFAGTRIDAIPGDHEAVDATSTDGPIVLSTSATLAGADLSGGWTLELWLYLPALIDEDTTFGIVDLGSILVLLARAHDATTRISLRVTDASAVAHATDVRAITLSTWQHWRWVWDGTDMRYFVDGTEYPSSSFPYAPGPRGGGWDVALPGDSSIGEVMLDVSVLTTGDPWADAPLAPAGTTVSVASTFIVNAAWLFGGGTGFAIPPTFTFAEKMLFRIAGTAPPASITNWQWFDWYTDLNQDSTYASSAYIASLVTSWTWYGPGDTTSDGLVLPADAAALYVTGASSHPSLGRNVGPPLVNRQFETDPSLGSNRVYWSSSTTTLRNLQRMDNVSTHTLPLLPDRLT